MFPPIGIMKIREFWPQIIPKPAWYLLSNSLGVLVRHSQINDCWGTSYIMPCLLYYETSSTLLKLRRYGFHVLRYGVRVSRVYSPYFPWWLDVLQRCFSCCSLLILLCIRQNIAEYEAYWLMGVPIIDPWGAQPFFLVHAVVCTN